MKISAIANLFLATILLVANSFALADTHAGTWVKKSNKIHGNWAIETRDDGRYLVLDEKFKTRNAPDLKFVLSNTPVSEVNGRNAMQGALIIEPLKSNKGSQSYKLPDNFDDYSTLLLHCEQYSKLWGAASLTH